MNFETNQNDLDFYQSPQLKVPRKSFKKSLTTIFPKLTLSPKPSSNENSKEEDKGDETSKTRSSKVETKSSFLNDFRFKDKNKEGNKQPGNSRKVSPLRNMKLDLKQINSSASQEKLENNKNELTPLDLPSPSLPAQKLEVVGQGETTKSIRQSTMNLINTLLGKYRESPKKMDDEDEDVDIENIDLLLENILIKFPPLIINPYGRFKYMWDFLMILLLVYFCYVLPIRLCFRKTPQTFELNRSTDYDDDWIIFDVICDFIILVDIVLNFFCAYENDAGLIVFSKRKITKRYITRWFFIDLISIFPINRKFFNLPHIELEDPYFNFENYKTWRIIRFIKLIRVFKLNLSIERLFSLMTLNVDKINIIKFVSFISIFIHITACLWNALAELQVDLGWEKVDSLADDSIFVRYISSLYFGLTILLTIGFGNIHPTTFPEKIVAILWMFFGIIVYTYIISSLTSSFSKLNQTQSVQEEKDLFFREWNKMFNLPYETLDMILNTIGIKNQSQSTQKMQALNMASGTLANLSKALYSEIYNNFFEDVLDKVMFFRNKPKQFLIKLIPLLKPTNFNQGDYIYKEKDPAMEVFFVVKGRVISKCLDRFQKARAQIFVEGSFFGEIDIFMKRNRTVCARAESPCELWKIDKEDFLDILNQFPPIKEEVEELVRIKEAYRKPMNLKGKTTSINGLPDTSRSFVNNFEEVEINEENGIFGALTDKMIKKIQKGTYHSSVNNTNTYESLDFEPDLPSPESSNSGRNILSEAEWKNFEKAMTQRLVRKKQDLKKTASADEFNFKAAGSLQKQFKYKNTGIKRRILKIKENRESLRKAILAKNVGTSGNWEVEFLAKKELMEELKAKDIPIDNTLEIDEIINGKQDLEKTRTNIIQKIEESETNLEKMITDAETMLAVLEQFEDGLEQMVDLTNLKQQETLEAGL